ncbi:MULTISPECIES: hypothetical protein [unclassified Halomonas]|uniref:hypothetical protein n=1 Tax=unclassified Halomonas TaxID=2609666 RepID=UPI0007DA1E44|nr:MULTISPECIES: hypothetical protein [unclassified Halomonas]MBT2784816.1 hypothetical protein [Halomonas sp. ISL-106]MBT2796510.1 hypothetical protein [Halomonas sp. ISL-104]OAL59756.1 hypothetical protein A6R74_00310 [Halomonas sp. ALS9]
MESSTSSEGAIDYSSHFDQMIAVGKQIHEELTLIREAFYTQAPKESGVEPEGEKPSLGLLVEQQFQLKQVAQQLFEHATNDQLGIHTRPKPPGDGGLSRAAMLNALKQSEQLDNVRVEMTNPTPMP